MSRQSDTRSIHLLTPLRIEPQLVEISAHGATAFTGTGFDPDDPQHWRGSDAVRYAIAIQQLRDARNFDAADVARRLAEQWYIIKQTGKSTHAVSFEVLLSGKKGGPMPMSIVGEILLDGNFLRAMM
jgi:hypothetical protein